MPLEDSRDRVVQRVLDVAEGKTAEVYSLPHPKNHLLKAIKAVLAAERIEIGGLAERLADEIQKEAAEVSEPPPPSAGPYLSLEEASEVIGLSVSTLRQQIHANRLQGAKIGRNWVTTKEWSGDYQRNVKRAPFKAF